MKHFQSRVVATWIVTLPIAFALVLTSHHKVERLRADAQMEVAKELRLAQHASFVGDFVTLFVCLVLLMVVVDGLGAFIRRLFPDRTEGQVPSD